MAITSANPDNDSTTKTALSFGSAAVGTDDDADGTQSLRAEFPTETGTGGTTAATSAKLSEYYRGGGVVPSSAAVEGQTQSEYDDNNQQLIESRWTFDAGRSGFPSEINNSAPDNLFYVRKVRTTQAPVPPVDILVEHERDKNEWRINYIQSQGGGAYIRIFYDDNVIYTSSVQANNTIQNITEQTVNVNGTPITFARGTGVSGFSYESNFKISTRTPVAVGDLLFAWQYPTTDTEDKHGYTFKISNGNIDEEYEHTDGYTYTTGSDASGVSVLKEETGEVMGFYPDGTSYQNKQYEFRYVNQPVYNTWYDRYYIKRRTTADATNNQTVPLNNLVPRSGPISFSQLYGSKASYESNVDIPGHTPSDEGYIWDSSLYPANIAVDSNGVETRSGVLPEASVYQNQTNGSEFRNMNVPLGTFFVDPSQFDSGIKLTLKASSAAQNDIKYYGRLDDDGGESFVKIRNIGIKIVNEASGNTALLYRGGETGDISLSFTGKNNGGSMKTFDRWMSRDLARIGTNFTSSTIAETGRFIVYLTFDYGQGDNYPARNDPDFKLSIDAVNVSWQTA